MPEIIDELSLVVKTIKEAGYEEDEPFTFRLGKTINNLHFSWRNENNKQSVSLTMDLPILEKIVEQLSILESLRE